MSGPHVLVVDDEPVNREITSELLGEVAAKVDLAADGVEALALASGKSYDLILMDLHMPRMDGLEATRRIRQLPGYADVPVLAITASNIEEVRSHCFAAGINDVLPKPVLPERFYTTLTEWLGLSDWLKMQEANIG